MIKTSPTAQAKRPPAVIVSVTLRPDRVAWIRQTANVKGISVSEVVRNAIDRAREEAEREAQPA